MDKFYITTPIYYVNDVPHIGHAYTTIAADVLARYHRQRGDDVFFLTGTDEHGQKNAQAAEARGLAPQVYVDAVSAQFRRLWERLNINHDDFIRTTSERHRRGVEAFWRRLVASGDVYRGTYAGWYCTACEAFYTDDELLAGDICPVHERPVEWTEEDNYFFALSRYQDRLHNLVANTDFVQPEGPRNELLGVLRQGLRDFSLTRQHVRWGIPVPNDRDHVIYVWADALTNYITALDFADEGERFRRYWPADVHLMGKEIVRFHGLYWPAMLMAAGVPLPRHVFAHGWLTKDGRKLSKTTGNIIDPDVLIDQFGADAVRYFFLREGRFGQDWNYTDAAFAGRYDADLANDLGNLLHRTLHMIQRYTGGVVPAPGGYQADEQALLAWMAELPRRIEAALTEFAFNDALVAIWDGVAAANRYAEESAPWILARQRHNGAPEAGERLDTVLYTLADTLVAVACGLAPFMPGKARDIVVRLGQAPEVLESPPAVGGCRPGAAVTIGEPLFPRTRLQIHERGQ
jgi:methionyl-tRNA synthetase